jgi:hypothetical protein
MCVCFCVLKIFKKNKKKYFFIVSNEYFLMFSNHFNVLISKKNLKIKNYYFNTFMNEKQPQPHSQTGHGYIFLFFS